jgi:hypothetical protein
MNRSTIWKLYEKSLEVPADRVTAFLYLVFKWLHDKQFSRSEAERNAQYLSFTQVRPPETVLELKPEIARIAKLNDPLQQRDEIRGFSEKKGLTLGWWLQNKKDLWIHGAEIWKDFPDDHFENAITDNGEMLNGHQQSITFIILVPAIAAYRPDLIPLVQQMIGASEYYWGAAAAYSCLAFFLRGEQQRTIIELALITAAKDFDDAQEACGMVLETVTEVVPRALLPFIAQSFVDYSKGNELKKRYREALYVMASRIEDQMWLLDILWPVVQKLDSSAGSFIIGASSHLDREWLTKFLIFSFQTFGNRAGTAYSNLCDRWLQLPRSEALMVWNDFLHYLSGRPRHELLYSLSWFSKVIIYLGKQEAAEDTANSILHVSDWWE